MQPISRTFSRNAFALLAAGAMTIAHISGTLDGAASLVLILLSVLGVALLLAAYFAALDAAIADRRRADVLAEALRARTIEALSTQAEAERLDRIVARLEAVRRGYRLGAPGMSSEGVTLRQVFAALDGRDLSPVSRRAEG